MELKTFYDNFDLLADAPNCISKLREMILHLAVQGKLVPQDPDDEPSKAFISKIKNEVPCRKNGKKRTLCDPIKEKDEPYQLPSGWTWERFGNVFDIQGGTQPPKSQFKDRPSQSHVRLYQIRDFGSKPVPIYVPRSSVKSFCSKDDVMLARYGASVGKIFMGEDGAYNVALTKVYFNHKGIFNRYVYFMLKSPLFQVPILSFSRSAQAGFNKGNIFPIILPFPPTNEQKRIVAKIEELMTLCDDMEARKQKAHYACIKVNDASINKLVSESTSNKFINTGTVSTGISTCCIASLKISTSFDKLFCN
jgi:type I restriction enzyme S subunit